MRVVDVIILVGWVAFWIFWLAASVGVKAGQTRWARFAGIRIVIILVILLLVRVRALKGHVTTANDPWLQGIGLAIFILGLALAIWARVYLGRNWGMPMSQKVDPELVTYRAIPQHSSSHLLWHHPGNDRHDDRCQLVLAGSGYIAWRLLPLQS